jgi:hypothetical protein
MGAHHPIYVIVLSVFLAEQLPVFVLLAFDIKQQLAYFRQQRKAAAARRIFSLVLFDCLRNFGNGVLDGDNPRVKIDTIPFQTEDFTTP